MRRARRAWIELGMFPKTVLRKAKRGLRKQQAAKFTRSLLERWKSGERETLWAELPPRPKARKAADKDSRRSRQDQAQRLVALARAGQAINRLVSPGLASDTPVVRQKLLAKFPSYDHSGRVVIPPAPPGLIDTGHVVKGIQSFKRGAGPGPTGLRADFLSACIGRKAMIL